MIARMSRGELEGSELAESGGGRRHAVCCGVDQSYSRIIVESAVETRRGGVLRCLAFDDSGRGGAASLAE